MCSPKTEAEIATMRSAGLVVANTLETLRLAAVPGATTADLDGLADDAIRQAGATPSFKGYYGFPASVCTSVNNEIVHGIPSRGRVLRDGDVISIDCGAIVDGWHGDAAVTIPVGDVTPDVARLLRVCEDALWRGLRAARVGGRLTDIGHAIESHVRSQGSYGLVREYVGHGIGTEMHQEPSVPNYGKPGRGPKLEHGTTLAVEPMVNLGSRDTRVLHDDWTVVTRDGRPSAHFEHTVALTEDGPWVLTAADGGSSAFGEAAVGAVERGGGDGP